ncbi:MAG TPA: hypothetical protein VJT84_00570, partial [Gaiellaceae bacterium]|nr:hypothetical protein [Gaiellaceae bacterium]
MNGSSSLHRLTRILVLGAVLAGATASIATAGATRPPDVRDVAASLGQAYVGSPPDIRDVATTGNLAVPDAFERFATAHPYGVGLSSQIGSTLLSRPPDVRDAAEAAAAAPDVIERYATAHPYGAGLSPATTSTLVSRPPDVRDAAEAARFVSVGQPSSGFDWNDWAIGIGSGIGIALL